MAKLFGVNTRTVKYVWNWQTWSYATEHLWASESELHASIESRLPKEVKRSRGGDAYQARVAEAKSTGVMLGIPTLPKYNF